MALQDSSIVQGSNKLIRGSSSLDNDRKIIDVALLWNSEIGITGLLRILIAFAQSIYLVINLFVFIWTSSSFDIGNVILITSDEGLRETAKRHGLPSELWKNLENNLSSHHSSLPWTASLLKSCMPGTQILVNHKLSFSFFNSHLSYFPSF